MERKNLEISKRSEKTQFSPIRRFNSLLGLAKEKRISVFELQIGQPDLETPKEFLERIKKFKGKILSYTDSLGFLETRKAWQKYYKDAGIDFKSSEIVITTGASESILFSFSAVCDPGDEIIVFEPFYSNYNGYASMLGIKLRPVRTFIENNFHLPEKKKILEKIGKKTKGILICNPNNPTGTVYQKEELKMISEIAKEKNLFVLSDETYREIIYDERKFYSMMHFKEIQDRVILIDSASKRFNICGARMGCLATKNKKIIEAVTKFAQARLSPPMLDQLALIPILKRSKKYTKKIVAEYTKRRNVVVKGLQKIPNISFAKPEGAFYMIVKLPIKDSNHFVEWLLTKFSFKKKTVMVAPASGFYANLGAGKDEIRIAFVLSVEKLREAIEIFTKGLQEYTKL